MSIAHALRPLTALYPLNTPRASLLRLLPRPPATLGEIKGKHGLHYHGRWSSPDEICQSLFWFGDFDPWVNATLTRFAKPGSTALDIGANIGVTAIALSRAVGPSGKVICFEPVPANLELLCRNIRRNRLTSVWTEPIALSNTVSKTTMVDNNGHSCISSDGDIPVSTIPFDQWHKGKELGDISICKIDVEGHELAVLEGMKRTLSARIIPTFVIELARSR